MDVYDFFAHHGVDLKNKASGSFTTQCPKCHHERKKKGTKELQVNIDIGWFKCYNCGFEHHILKENGFNEPISFKPKPPPKQNFISPEPVFNWIIPDAVIEPKPVKPLTGKYHITWYYRNIHDKLTGAKKMAYNFTESGFNRIKDEIPLHLYQRDSGYYPCLFYERDLYLFPHAKVILLESEKTAAILRKRFKQHLSEYIYLATGGANGLTDDKAKVLSGREVLICYDCDNGELQKDGTITKPKGREAAQTALVKLAGICKVKVVDIDPSLNDGSDLADIDIDIDGIRKLTGENKFPPELINDIQEHNKNGDFWSTKLADTLAERHLINRDSVLSIGRVYYEANKHEHGLNSAPQLKKIEYFLLNRFEFRRNSINKKIFYRDKSVPNSEFTFCNYNDIWRLLQHNLPQFSNKGKINITDVSNLLESDFVQEVNPFHDYFHSLPHWDGVDHITNLANYIQTSDQPFWIEQFKKAFVRMIACTYGNIENRIVMTLVQEKQESGKCFGIGTKVLMADFSIKRIEDIKIGDQVMGPDGSPRNVLELHQGVDQMYWVHQNNAMNYRVNSNHILALQKRPHRYGSQAGKKINIHLNQFLRTNKDYQFNHLGYRAQFDFSHKETPIDPYFLGLWLGDGDMNYPRIFTADMEIVEYLQEFSKREGFHLTVHSQSEKTNKSKVYTLVHRQVGKANDRVGGVQNKRLNRYIEAFKEINVYRNKHIPDQYKYNSKECRLQLLAGIIDSDGHMNQKQKRNFEVTFKSYKLAKDLEVLARTLGFRANLYKRVATMKRKDNTYFNCDVYRVNIWGRVEDIPTKVKRKQARKTYKLSKNSLTTGIKIIEDIVDDYFGFTTDGDNLFLLEDFTVVHNSNFLSFLCPPELHEYYKEDPMVINGKDTEIALSENFIWNLDELATLNKKEINELKGVISRRSIKQRKAYARQEVTQKRIVNFWGSTNKEDFLSDTQNTRWLCFRVLSVNHDYNNYRTNVRNIDITKVWAQAWYLYKTNFNYSLDEDERKKRDLINHDFEVLPIEKELILKYITTCDKTTPNAEFVTVSEILEYLTKQTDKSMRLSAENIGRSMTQLGFTKDAKKVNNKTMKGYWALRQALKPNQSQHQSHQSQESPMFNEVPGLPPPDPSGLPF